MSPGIKQIYKTFCSSYKLELVESYRYAGLMQYKFNVIGPMDTIEIFAIGNTISSLYTSYGCL